MHPAARVGDPHECKAHGTSPLSPPGCPTVLIGSMPAARQGDVAICTGSPDTVLDGSPTVRIGNQAAARQTERCAHGGTVLVGFPTVLIGNPAVDAEGRAKQIPPECQWLLDFGNKATGQKLDRYRGAYRVVSTEAVTVSPPGSPDGEYVKRVVEIRGHQVTIYEPVNGVPPPQWLPSSDHMAQALSALSDRQLQGMKEVYIVPHPYPPRPSDIANHKNGVVQYFPRDAAHPQADIDWVFQHESAHYIWDAEIAKDPGFSAAWQRAIDKDHRSVSAYGDTGIGEDFADFMVLYAIVLGTPCEASARALFKSRMAIMDKLYPGGLPNRSPGGASKAY